MKRNFMELVERQWSSGNFVCVGLDSDISKMPGLVRFPRKSDTIAYFNQKVVAATRDLACAYKIDCGFYFRHGAEGFFALQRTVDDIHKISPETPVILDGKFGGTAIANAGYAEMAFGFFGADAVTVLPGPGAFALRPFTDRFDKGVFVVCHNSDSGAPEFQEREIYVTPEECQILFCDLMGGYHREIPNDPILIPFYQYVAYQVANEWNVNGNCGVVIGATYPEALQEVRQIVNDIPILTPAIGAQQKDVPLEEQIRRVVSRGMNRRNQGVIISSSRSIIFASQSADFAEAVRGETLRMHTLINRYRDAERAAESRSL